MPQVVRGDGISRRQAKKVKQPIGKRRAAAIQNAKWARQSGKVRIGRLEDLPEDHPARQA